MEGWILLGKIKKVPSIWIRRGRFLLFYSLFLFSRVCERSKISLSTQRCEDFELLRYGFAGESFDNEGWNLLDGLKCFWNIAVIAELPRCKQFFYEFRPRKVVGRVHGESCWLEVVSCIEQKAPVFITGENGGLARCVFGRLLGWNVQNELQFYAVARSSRWRRLYSYSEIEVIFKMSSRFSPALISSFA